MHAEPDGVTARLARWAATNHPDDVPAEVREATRRLALDGLGCGVFGAAQPWTAVVRDLVLFEGGPEEVTLWGTGQRVPATRAPLVNGTAMHAFEYDDLHPQAVIHAGAQVLPAALAAAELHQVRSGAPAVSEQDFLHALVIGFEVGARIGRATGAGQLARGFHPSPNSGTFAAAAAVGRLLGLGPDQMADALGVAGSFGGYLMAAQYGAMVKRVHPGHAAQSGLVAALLAQRGLTGTRGVLEAPYGGFATAFADSGADDLALVTRELGDHWEIPGYTIKYYPCCGSNHTAIDAWWETLEQLPGTVVDDVERLEVRCSTLTLDHVGWPYTPDTVTTAQMNLRYCLAAAAVDGRFSVDQLEPARLTDPRVLDMVARISVAADPDIDALGRDRRHLVRLRTVLRDGRETEVRREHARGSAAHPLGTDEVLAKFRSLTRSLTTEATDELADRVLGLEGGNELDVAALAALTSPTSR